MEGAPMEDLKQKQPTSNWAKETISDEAKTESNPQKNQAKSPTENRHRESQFTAQKTHWND